MQKADLPRRKVGKPRGDRTHELRSAGGFLPPGPVTPEAPVSTLTLDDLVTGPLERSDAAPEPVPMTATWVPPASAASRVNEIDLHLPEVREDLAERLLQNLEPSDWSAMAMDFLAHGKLKEYEISQPVENPTTNLNLNDLLELTAPKPTRAQTRMMPAVSMKPNLSLLELLDATETNVPKAPAVPKQSIPTQNRMMPAVPEALPFERERFSAMALQRRSMPPTDPPKGEDESWVSLSSFVELINDMLPAKSLETETTDTDVNVPPPVERRDLGTSSTRSEGSVVGSAEKMSSLDESLEEDPALATMRQEDLNAANDAEVKDCTSLLLRNLPLDYGQQKTMDLIDSFGYRDLYDLVLWFPSKKSSHRKTSSVFINFRSCETAQRFAKQFHQLRPNDFDIKLNVSMAIVQGFTENFVKYWHLTQKDSSGSICCPFFAKDQLESVTEETMERAKSVKEELKKDLKEVSSSEWTETTLVIRNLPQEIENQDQAIQWLAELGYGQTYDFLLYVPRKSNQSKKVMSLAYIFVNFVEAATAKVCCQKLSQKVCDGMPLSVVTSHIQGRQACIDRFRNVAETGRLVPFIADPEKKPKQPEEYQLSPLLWQ